jgi:uncharacterized membrane protein YphA (DoxX/SURF4 family)
MIGVLQTLLRVLIGGYFVQAAWGKLLDPGLFAEAVRGYDLLPDPWVAIVALGLPWLECVAGLGLALGFWYRGALGWVGLCLLAFVLALGSAWWRGLEISCGCLGHGGGARGAMALLRQAALDLLMLGLVVWLGLFQRQASSHES